MTEQPAAQAGDPRPSFVLHEHRKPRHHFDLRLEEDGVLRSWAVPRGLPPTSGQNRLAVQVPDHDLEHLTYQDENKSIADIGWWEQVDRNDRRLVFILHGRSGASTRYALIRTSSDWLLHRTKEQPVGDPAEVEGDVAGGEVVGAERSGVEQSGGEVPPAGTHGAG